jgi:hypothetical protein
MRVDCDFESAGATPGTIDEKPPAAIHAPNIPETSISQDALTIPTRDGAAVVEAGADVQVDRDRLRGGGHKRWRRKA